MSINTYRNINTVDYWNLRFGSGDWASHGGYAQTRLFAQSQLSHLRLAPDFAGRVLDFGCGAGDAFPVYRAAWPKAKLIGVDFSVDAIRLCRERFGHLADFVCGGPESVPPVDMIICSNVLEHVEDDIAVVAQLIGRCARLMVIVPYEEHPLSVEHVRRYGDDAFGEFRVARTRIFNSPGWTEYGVRSIARIWIGNLWRCVKGLPMRRRRRQILFEIAGRARCIQ